VFAVFQDWTLVWQELLTAVRMPTVYQLTLLTDVNVKPVSMVMDSHVKVCVIDFSYSFNSPDYFGSYISRFIYLKR